MSIIKTTCAFLDVPPKDIFSGSCGISIKRVEDLTPAQSHRAESFLKEATSKLYQIFLWIQEGSLPLEYQRVPARADSQLENKLIQVISNL